jgi:PAS domain S-box-containing protein
VSAGTVTTDAEIDELRRRVAELEQRVRAADDERATLRKVLDTLPAIVLKVALDGTIEYINHVQPAYQARPPVGESIYSYAPPDQHEVMRSAIDTAIHRGQLAEYESIALAPDGSRDWYHTVVAPVREGGRIVGVTLGCISITRLKTAEQALRESREQVALALDAGDVGVWRWDRTTDLVTWDKKLCSMFGLTPEEAPKTVAEFLALVSEDQRAAMSAHISSALTSGVYLDFELRADTPERTRWFVIKGGVLRDDSGEAVGLLGGVIDHTEHRRLIEHVREAQKLDAMGQLAAGVAHNFNNMLAGIVPVLEMAARETHGPLAGFLLDAQESALRAAELVKDLLLVGRGGPGHSTGRPRERLSVVVERVVELCRRTFGRRIILEKSVADVANEVRVDGVQMEQALLNLLLNARDALEGVDEARISVTVALAEGGASSASAAPGVEVLVRDSGRGMDEATRTRVFEPFFTTKPVGSGTGLGLATAWATAKTHGGRLSCESTPGVGSVFTLWLPAATDASSDAPRASSPAPEEIKGARVLVVDDEDAVRRATALCLESLGYRVLLASSGVEGVRIFAEQPVDVVLLDHSMPGQSTNTTMRSFRSLSPDVPVVIFSGLPVEIEGASGHLAKPATVSILHDELQRVLRR